jgi:hypothetical protein
MEEVKAVKKWRDPTRNKQAGRRAKSGGDSNVQW